MTIDIETLRNVGWIADLDEQARGHLSAAVEQSHDRGTFLTHAKHPSAWVFIVREGGLKEVQTTPEGKDAIVALHGPGDLVGDLVSDSEPQPASAVTLTTSKVWGLPREQWLRILDENPSLRREALQQRARQVTEAWRLVRMLSRYTTEARLRSAMLLLAERWGRPGPEGVEISLDLTHRTLAELAGASREKVTRALGILQRKGLVKVVRRRLVLPSLELFDGD